MGEGLSRLTLDGTLAGPFIVPPSQAGASEGVLPDDDQLRMADVGAFLRRHLVLIAAVTGVAGAAGLAYVMNATPLYTATAQVVVDPQRPRVTVVETANGSSEIGAPEIENQVVTITSDPVVRNVVSSLHLVDDPELHAKPSSLQSAWQALRDRLPGASAPEPDLPDADIRMRETIRAVQSRLSADRLGQSYVIQVLYSSADPVKAAAVANATANAFLAAGIQQKSEAVRVGAAWLDDRLVEIGEKANAAASAVEQFRRDHRIAGVNDGTGASLEERQLVQMSQERLQARAAVATETASLAAIDKVLANGDLDGGYTSEALQSTSIARIREALLGARSREADLVARYGPDGEAVRASQAEIARLQGEIRDELLRIRATHTSSLDAAKLRADLVEGDFRTALTDNSAQDAARVGLAELESRERTYRTMYENALLQVTSATQKESFPLGDSRLVSEATVPLAKSSPKSGLIVTLSIVLGACVAVALAGLREAFDRSVRSPERLRRHLGLATLGTVPRAAAGGRRKPSPASLRNFALEEPYSAFTERMRAVKSTIDLNVAHRGRVLGVTSTMHGEGKTTVAANLAHMYAAEGFQTLLIEADGRNDARSSRDAAPEEGAEPFLTRLAGETDEAERTEHGAPRTACDSVTLLKRGRERGRISTQLQVVTAENLRALWNVGNRYEQNVALCACIASARQQFDTVICDLPALEGDADTELLAAQHLDRVILVLGGHRKVSLDRIAKAVFRHRHPKFPLLGVVFNKYRHA